MKIFISWSGPRSQVFSEHLADWLQDVIQSVTPWVSSDDIEKGTQWQRELGTGLDESDFGIVCVTRETLNAPWILFEAGALSRSFEQAAPRRVAVFLLDIEQASDLTGPLSQFNATAPNKQDVFRLVQSINSVQQELQIEQRRLSRTFESNWPTLERALEVAQTPEELRAIEKPSSDDGRQTFADPVQMFPFLLERCDVCDSPERRLDVLGLTLGATWANLQFYLLREEVTDWRFVFTSFQGVTPEVEDHWAEETRKTTEEIREFFARDEIRSKNLSGEASTYGFAPAVHGYRLSNGDLFMATACRDGAHVSRKECPYEFIPGSDESLYARTQRKVFQTWFDAANAGAQSS